MQAVISTAAAPPAAPRAPDPKLAAAAREFEAVFIAEMLKPMMETVPTDGPFGGGNGEEMFRGILTEQVGQAITRGGGIGLARSVEAQLVRLQEAGGHER